MQKKANKQKIGKSDPNIGRNKQGQKLPMRVIRLQIHREIFESSHIITH